MRCCITPMVVAATSLPVYSEAPATAGTRGKPIRAVRWRPRSSSGLVQIGGAATRGKGREVQSCALPIAPRPDQLVAPPQLVGRMPPPVALAHDELLHHADGGRGHIAAGVFEGAGNGRNARKSDPLREMTADLVVGVD